MLDSESSLRINLLRFPLIIGVVFIHTYGNTVGFSGGQIVGVIQPNFIVDFVRNFISQGLARTSVPLFFMMSGYLFFAGFVWSKKSYVIKLMSRTKTLLVPFLFWNIATLGIIALVQAIPATQIFLSGDNPLISTFGVFDYLNAIIGLTRSPIAYQFWFIRDLIILVLLSPLISIAIKYLPLPFLFLVLIFWLVGGWPLYAPSSEALLFFSLGAYLASTNKSLFFLDNFGRIITVFYLLIVTIDVITINQSFNPYLHKLGILLGIYAVLFFTKFFAKNEKFKLLLLQLSSASFFVFAIHEPLLTILKKMSYKLISPESSPESSFMVLALYFFIPTITILFAILAYRVFTGMTPKLVSIVVGGR